LAKLGQNDGSPKGKWDICRHEKIFYLLGFGIATHGLWLFSSHGRAVLQCWAVSSAAQCTFMDNGMVTL
jgi:hypothetical protein